MMFARALRFGLVLFGQPLPAGDRSGELARQVDPRLLADTQFASLVLDHVAMAVGEIADREEVRVRRDLQGFDQPHRAIVGVAGIAELLGPNGDARAPAEALGRVDHAAFQRRHRCDRLECRTRRIGTVDRPVD